MTLRKIAALGLAASTLALVGTSVAGAVGSDVQGPSCADIVDGVGGYGATDVGIQVQLAAPSCAGVMYNLIAVDEVGSQTIVGSTSVAGDGSSNLVLLNATITDDDDTVCVYVTTTAGRGPHVFDRAPDAGCVSMTRNSAPGFQDFS
jgi:hypothetical protein